MAAEHHMENTMEAQQVFLELFKNPEQIRELMNLVVSKNETIESPSTAQTKEQTVEFPQDNALTFDVELHDHF